SRGGSSEKGKSFSRGNAPEKKQKFSTSKPEVEKKAAPKKSNPNEIRLNKYIANSGICSRREADEHNGLRLVAVSGKLVIEMSYTVELDDDGRYDGRRVNAEKKAYV